MMNLWWRGSTFSEIQAICNDFSQCAAEVLLAHHRAVFFECNPGWEGKNPCARTTSQLLHMPKSPSKNTVEYIGKHFIHLGWNTMEYHPPLAIPKIDIMPLLPTSASASRWCPHDSKESRMIHNKERNGICKKCCWCQRIFEAYP